MAPAIKPVEDAGTAPWGLSVAQSDFEKLKAGLQPKDMDDRWIISVTEPDKTGAISIHVARSWTGIQHFTLAAKQNDDKTGLIEAITWAQCPGGVATSQEQAQKEAISLFRSHLDCEFKNLPDYPDA